MPKGIKKNHATISYTEKIGEKICTEIARGRSLVSLCKEMHLYYEKVTGWMNENPSFAERYARARDAQADYLAEEVLDIAANKKLDNETRRLMIDTRKWYAGKVRPKKYSDKQVIEHTGDKDKPVVVENKRSIAEELAEVCTLEQLKEIERRVNAADSQST